MPRMKVFDVLFGRPLATLDERAEKIGVSAGIPIFGLDALSSAAYGPEAALTILLPLGAAGVVRMVPITGAIILLLGIVFFSYRQTISTYPNGGGGGNGQKRPPQVHEDGRKVLEALTAKTGGRTIDVKKTDEISGALETIAADVRSSYLLTYTPDPELGNGFHRIGMTVPKHGDWTVQATEGIYTGH